MIGCHALMEFTVKLPIGTNMDLDRACKMFRKGGTRRLKTLREWRDERVLSTRELAKRAGDARQTLISAEIGATLPNRHAMRQMAEALNVEPRDIAELVDAVELQEKGIWALGECEHKMRVKSHEVYRKQGASWVGRCPDPAVGRRNGKAYCRAHMPERLSGA